VPKAKREEEEQITNNIPSSIEPEWSVVHVTASTLALHLPIKFILKLSRGTADVLIAGKSFVPLNDMKYLSPLCQLTFHLEKDVNMVYQD
jgi:hypothetical protein